MKENALTRPTVFSLALLAATSVFTNIAPSFAQSTLTPGLFCYSVRGGLAVYCFERDAQGHTKDAKPPKSTGGSFAQEKSHEHKTRRFGSCTEEQKKKVCEEEAESCTRSATVRATPTQIQQKFPVPAERILKEARLVPTDLGAPAGVNMVYDFTYSMSCEGKDIPSESGVGRPPRDAEMLCISAEEFNRCEYSIRCTVRGDFTF